MSCTTYKLSLKKNKSHYQKKRKIGFELSVMCHKESNKGWHCFFPNSITSQSWGPILGLLPSALGPGFAPSLRQDKAAENLFLGLGPKPSRNRWQASHMHSTYKTSFTSMTALWEGYYYHSTWKKEKIFSQITHLLKSEARMLQSQSANPEVLMSQPGFLTTRL